MDTPNPAPKGSILLVEDDEFLSGLLTQRLEEKGFAVAVAKDGETAVSLACEHVPDLLLLDIFLPGMSGFEAIAKLRQNEATAKVPFMVLSNSAESQSKQEAEKLGAERYLVKAQVTPIEIVEVIDAWFKAK